MTIPKKLYKYRRFDVRALDIVATHSLHYTNPRKFNDPLDCELAIEPDLSPRKLADLLKALMGSGREHLWCYEVSCAVHYASEIGNIKVAGKARNYLKSMLADAIGSEIRKEFDARGVLSFSATWKSVLMWSHYADEHRGLCFEFDTTEIPHEHLSAVSYEGARSVKASDIYAWKMHGDEVAAKRAFEIHFYSKAPDWKYEQEWRDVSDKPGQCGDYRVTGIYFGFRCDHAARVAIVKMLGVGTNVELFDVHLARSSFELCRVPVDIGEIDVFGMQEPEGIETARIIAEFEDLNESGDEEQAA